MAAPPKTLSFFLVDATLAGISQETMGVFRLAQGGGQTEDRIERWGVRSPGSRRVWGGELVCLGRHFHPKPAFGHPYSHHSSLPACRSLYPASNFTRFLGVVITKSNRVRSTPNLGSRPPLTAYSSSAMIVSR